MTTYFIDTNIFMYAAGAAHRFKEPCQKIIQLMAEGGLKGATNTETLQEILYRYLSIRKKREAFECMNQVLELVDACWPVTVEEVRGAEKLIENNPSLQIRDAIHISSMLFHDIKEIISADKDFDVVREIKRIDPTEFR